MLIYITLFLLLSKCNISLCYTPSIVHALSKLYSLLLIKRFASICRHFGVIPVLDCTRLKPLKKLKGAYLNALVI